MMLPKRARSLSVLMALVALIALGLHVWETHRQRDPVYRHLRILRYGDDDGRRSAVEALGRLGAQAAIAVPALARAVEADEAAEVRRAAAEVLIQIAPKAEPSLQAWRRALNDPDLQVRETAFRGLSDRANWNQETHDALLGLLDDPDPALKWRAIGLLAGRESPSERVLLAGIDELLRTDADRWNFRWPQYGEAVLRLPLTEAAVRRLAEALEAPDAEEENLAIVYHREARRAAAGNILIRMARTADSRLPGLVPTLLNQLREGRTGERGPVAHLLSGFEPGVRRQAVAILEDWIEAGEDGRAIEAAVWLSWFPLENERALRLIAEGLQGENWEQMTALVQLILIGPSALEVVPEVAEAMLDPVAHATDPSFYRNSNNPMLTDRHSSIPRPGDRSGLDRDVVQIVHRLQFDVRSPSVFRLGNQLLERLGPEAELAAIKHFLAVLGEGDHGRSQRAMVALGEFGQRARPAIPALVALLKNPEATEAPEVALEEDHKRLEASIRARAIETLGKVGSGDDWVLATLIETLEYEEPFLRQQAMRALGVLKAGAAVPRLLEIVASQDNGEDRRAAVFALLKIEPDPEAVAPVLREAMRTEDWNVRVAAAGILSQGGPIARPVVPDMVAMLRVGNERTREDVSKSLGQIGPDAEEALPALLSVLNDESPGVREAASIAISEIVQNGDRIVYLERGRGRRRAPAPNIQDLEDEDPLWRRRAAVAFGLRPRGNTEEVEALPYSYPSDEDLALRPKGNTEEVEALSKILEADVDALNRAIAAMVLGRMGEGASALLGAFDDPDAEVRRAAVDALGRLADAADEAIPALIAVLNIEDDQLPMLAARSLGRFGAYANSSVPALSELLERGETPAARVEAARALGRIGQADREAVEPLVAAYDREPMAIVREWAVISLGGFAEQDDQARATVLRALAEDEARLVRRSAVHAVARLGPDAEIVIPALIKALEDEDPYTRSAAGSRLGQFRPAFEVVPILLEVIEHGPPVARAEAASALLHCRVAEVREAVPTLARLLSDRDPIVRLRVAEALQKLGREAAPVAEAMESARQDDDPWVRATASRALRDIKTRTQSYKP